MTPRMMLSCNQWVLLVLAGWLSCVTCLQCYTCTGKKNQCDSSADPGMETNCQSVFSLIRPSVMITLDLKFRETSGNRTDKMLKNVLLTTFSGMFGGIPSLAIDKALKDISEDPVKEDLVSLNQKIFSSMEKDCKELGCTFTSDLKTNITALESDFDAKYEEKINVNTTRRAIRNSFKQIETVILNGTMDSALNITLDTTKDDLAVEIAGIITKLDEDCTAVPCSFTADIKTAADELLDANWTSLHAMKNAENVTHVLETVFLAFESLLPMPTPNTSFITNETSVDDLKTKSEEFWIELKEGCTADCTGAANTAAATTLDSSWTADLTVAEVQTLFTNTCLTMISEKRTFFRDLADTTSAAQTLTETSTFSEMTAAVAAVSDAITANIVEENKLPMKVTFDLKKEIAWGLIAPTVETVKSNYKKILDQMKDSVESHYFTLRDTNLDSSLGNLTGNITKEDMDSIVTTILGKINEECKAGGCVFTETLKTFVEAKFDTEYSNMKINSYDMEVILKTNLWDFSKEISLGPDSSLLNYTKNITARTMLSDLVKIADEALADSLGDGPDNGCTYLEKKEFKQYFRGCLYTKKSYLDITQIPMIKVDLTKTVEPISKAKICTEPYCNDQMLFTCFVCDGPNNICKHNELGTSQACQADEKYCIKELSGDDSNRELVARKCGNEFDKYLACGSETDGEENDEDTGGGKIGIAASGDVVCCDNRMQKDCNMGDTTAANIILVTVILTVLWTLL